MTTRCDWALQSKLEQDYHDNEWGKPVHEDQKLFEFFVLESMQAGLSWSLILKKRNNFKKALDDFDYRKIATYNEEKVQSLLNNPGIVRNQLKIRATIHNAQEFLRIQEEYGSFDHFIWKQVDNQITNNQWTKISDVPSSSDLSDQVTKRLKKEGFKFLGTTSVYSFLQAVRIINDHLISCDFK